ncbi:hypothetical protein C8F01DRAFT_1232200 [Mycena amicta]|nr:hypothetical protein C8F01DRAFT_1232200 [Mycena amicta]
MPPLRNARKPIRVPVVISERKSQSSISVVPQQPQGPATLAHSPSPAFPVSPPALQSPAIAPIRLTLRIPPAAPVPKTSGLKTFMPTMYKLLSSKDATVTRAVSWSADGTIIVITDVELWEKTVLPAYFPKTKPASWKRAMNAYGFKRTAVPGTTIVAWAHATLRNTTSQLEFVSICGASRTKRKLDSETAVFTGHLQSTKLGIESTECSGAVASQEFCSPWSSYGMIAPANHFMSPSIPLDLAHLWMVPTAQPACLSLTKMEATAWTQTSDLPASSAGNDDLESPPVETPPAPVENFLVKIYRMAKDPANAAVIGWDRGGRLAIWDPDQLPDLLMQEFGIVKGFWLEGLVGHGFQLTAMRYSGRIVSAWKHPVLDEHYPEDQLAQLTQAAAAQLAQDIQIAVDDGNDSEMGEPDSPAVDYKQVDSLD